MVLKEITEKTLLPISIVLVIIAAAVHFTSIASLAEQNQTAIKQLKQSKTRIYDQINELKQVMYRTEGKLDTLINSVNKK